MDKVPLSISISTSHKMGLATMANPVPIFLGLVRLKFCPKNQMRQQVVAGECDDDDIGRMIEGA
jgi:hypothetical protein